MKLVVCFPGIDYHCDKPLLYYSRKLAACAGYDHTLLLQYTYHKDGLRGSPAALREAFDTLYAQAEAQLSAVDWPQYDDVLFLSKSIGTAVSAAFAQRHGIPLPPDSLHAALPDVCVCPAECPCLFRSPPTLGAMPPPSLPQPAPTARRSVFMRTPIIPWKPATFCTTWRPCRTSCRNADVHRRYTPLTFSLPQRIDICPASCYNKLYKIYAVEHYSSGRKREHSKVCIQQVTLSAGNPITAGFIGCRVPNLSSLSCIEISHFSKRYAGRCDKKLNRQTYRSGRNEIDSKSSRHFGSCH
mgnify:CR=1 FL=1